MQEDQHIGRATLRLHERGRGPKVGLDGRHGLAAHAHQVETQRQQERAGREGAAALGHQVGANRTQQIERRAEVDQVAVVEQRDTQGDDKEQQRRYQQPGRQYDDRPSPGAWFTARQQQGRQQQKYPDAHQADGGHTAHTAAKSHQQNGEHPR